MAILIENSLSDYLRVIEPEIVPELICKANWQSIQAIAGCLPSALTSFFGFESRLDNEDSWSDFLICVAGETAGKKILGNVDGKTSLPLFLKETSVWQRIDDFAGYWNQDDSPIGQFVHNMWLEFDVDESLNDIPIPSVFFGLTSEKRALHPIGMVKVDGEMGRRGDGEKNSFSSSQIIPQLYNGEKPGNSWNWVTEKALPLLLGKSLPEGVNQQILQCFATLPQEAYIFQIGLMLARKTNAVRLCIRNLQPQQITEFLSGMNWQGCIQSLAEVLQILVTLVDRIDLDIDVGETIYPKIGLECYLDKQPLLQPKWNLFLDWLVAQGLCTKQKQSKLLRYPGYVRPRDRLALYPDYLIKINRFLPQWENVFFRGIHHIKLSYQSEEILAAKAYLYVSHNQIDVPQFKQLITKFHHVGI